MNRGNEARKAELHRQMEDALNAINYTHNKPLFTDQRQQAWESYFDAQKQLYALNQNEMNNETKSLTRLRNESAAELDKMLKINVLNADLSINTAATRKLHVTATRAILDLRKATTAAEVDAILNTARAFTATHQNLAA